MEIGCRSGALEMLEFQGVEYIDTYCVDNALARLADPHFLGLASLRRADVCEPPSHQKESLPSKILFECVIACQCMNVTDTCQCIPRLKCPVVNGPFENKLDKQYKICSLLLCTYRRQRERP